MKYKGENRIITILWCRGPHGRVTLEVVADPAQAYQGDTITWVVQGPGHPDGITVANFERIGAAPRLRVERGLVSLRKPLGFPESKMKVNGDRTSIKVGRAPVGWYKYDVVQVQNGVKTILLDPEIEIRGPGGPTSLA